MGGKVHHPIPTLLALFRFFFKSFKSVSFAFMDSMNPAANIPSFASFIRLIHCRRYATHLASCEDKIYAIDSFISENKKGWK